MLIPNELLRNQDRNNQDRIRGYIATIIEICDERGGKKKPPKGGLF
jgi:hypothetical protein